MRAVILAALLLGGCATTAAQQATSSAAKGPCLSLRPHFPERVQVADTEPTKRKAYSRNVAYGTACGDRR